MKRWIFVSLLLLLLVTLPVSAYYWYTFTHPFPQLTSVTTLPITHQSIAIPAKNKQIITFVEKHGKEISPTYFPNVCTEFVIGVLSNFITLTKKDRIRIRIITTEDIFTLRKQKSPIVSGVCFALVSSGKGVAIDSISQVMPGDFVQF
jgi:hypothetical protein